MSELIHISQNEVQGLGGQVEGGAYTIMLLNHMPRLSPGAVGDMHRHLETDESFILLRGKAILFVSPAGARPAELEAQELEPGMIFTVPRGTWHAQAMSEDARILLVESSGTVAENSPRCQLDERQRAYIKQRGDAALA